MAVLWKGIQVTFAFFLIAGLLFASGVFAVLLYAKATGHDAWITPGLRALAAAPGLEAAAAGTAADSAAAQPEPAAAVPPQPVKPASAMLDAPMVRQLPELPSGCEVTSLTMLLKFRGLEKSKLELAAEMPRDTTPIRYNKDGTIAYWGNPNTGFVGEPTGAAKGFGIYHTALFAQLKAHVPSAIDLTRQTFAKLEEQLQLGIPSVVWTTIDYQVPEKWVVWDTPIGPIQTTFMEHAVLLVGYDETYVYVNDPLSGRSKQPIEKAQFIAVWEAMGRQAISYTNG
ncbi:MULTISPECIES: C39 family peptidase [unclassified Paenibacillus]|uniref:C39 family peptidase n=1 Tax=unclassified Paenibacillus TaxID=185978 RepID=UPI001142F290|nr:C39 family peptidase [Paenibacillus sp. tmac-D7]